jgi:Golgi nucleoside diphosphatase
MAEETRLAMSQSLWQLGEDSMEFIRLFSLSLSLFLCLSLSLCIFGSFHDLEKRFSLMNERDPKMETKSKF